MTNLEIRPADAGDRGWILRILEEHWGGAAVVSRGRIHRADELPALVALLDGERVGLLTYRIADAQCEIVSLDSLVIGAGRPLIDAIRRTAVESGCRRLWLITTNDNLGALRFYQKVGFVLFAVHPNALEISRRLKPSIPSVGIGGIPLRDEIELEMPL
jgi:GNAT superfamily N-acetyltransferase